MPMYQNIDPTDPTYASASVTPAGKPAGGAPPDPVVLRVRPAADGKDESEASLSEVLNSDWAVLVVGSIQDAVAALRAKDLSPFALVSFRESRFDTVLVEGRLKDL
jgi:hypothetical protein